MKRAAAFLVAVAMAACSPSPSHQAGAQRLTVVTTMSTLASLVEAVAGDRADVRNLVPVGVSPEDYQPTPKDVAALHDAGVLIENGTGLESWLAHSVDAAKNPSLRILVCTDGMPVKGNNPHLWMNPMYAKVYVSKIAQTLGAADPGGAATYRQNLARYRGELDTLDAWIRSRIQTIPKAQRNMIVFHNAWQYYNDRYGINTVGAIELSPGQEPSPQYIANLVQLAKQYRVRAVFAEPEYSPKLAQALAGDAGIQVVTDLYDDSLSTERVRDYISMLRYDTDTIVRALR